MRKIRQLIVPPRNKNLQRMGLLVFQSAILNLDRQKNKRERDVALPYFLYSQLGTHGGPFAQFSHDSGRTSRIWNQIKRRTEDESLAAMLLRLLGEEKAQTENPQTGATVAGEDSSVV